jgi:hypothetical protein
MPDAGELREWQRSARETKSRHAGEAWQLIVEMLLFLLVLARL